MARIPRGRALNGWLRAGAIPFEQGLTLYALAHALKRLVKMFGSNHASLTRDGLYDQIWTFLNLPLPASTAEAGHRASVEVMSAPR